MVQPPEISGGSGFSFEDAPVAFYLGALLGEEAAPGLEGRVITRVAVQQAAFGEPLDDVIVDGRAPDDSLARLSLQVKRQLTISAAASNTDFREIVTCAWATLAKPGFRESADRVGAVTGTVSERSRRSMDAVCGWARASDSVDVFLDHFQDGAASEDRRRILETFRRILADQANGKVNDAGVYRLLRHFVLIKLDVLHAGATDESHAIERLRSHLQDSSRAADLWNKLLRIARDAAGRAAEYSRASLLTELGGAYRLAGARSLREHLDWLNEETKKRRNEETKNALSSITNDIAGVEIARPSHIENVNAALKTRRFVHIIGRPGTGKSAVLRACLEAERHKGTVLLLKSDRLTGPSWSAYARALGLTSAGLEPLLCEIAASGSSVLFIDAIDRVEVQNRGILQDILTTIITSPLLENWKVVATSRDTGIEPLRTWLPADFFGEEGVATVVVEPFDDDESAALAEARPALQPVLFGDDRVREIARRPFFAAVLAQTFGQGHATQAAPKSEIELIEVWWSRGGYNSDEPRIHHRQRGLIQLAKAGAFDLGRRMRLDGVDLDAVRDLKRDNVVKNVSAGHTVKFAHDIFFEWAFLHLLIDRDQEWLEEIRSIGEPPVLGRVVELLSQAQFTTDDRWEESLQRLESSPMRHQWTRAWLIAPFGVPTFWDRSKGFTEVMLRDKARRLSKLAVWFQADKTKANPMVLDRSLSAGNLTRTDIVRLADALAWPSDMASWGRFCAWVIRNIEQFPVDTIPDVVSAFEVWQNMFATLRNAVSDQIIETIAQWLEDIEDRQHPEQYRYNPGRWAELGRGGSAVLEERLRTLMLYSAQTDQERVRIYLQRVNERKHLRHSAFRQIILLAPILSVHHSDELVAVTLAEVGGPLPAEVAMRPVRPHVLPHSFLIMIGIGSRSTTITDRSIRHRRYVSLLPRCFKTRPRKRTR